MDYHEGGSDAEAEEALMASLGSVLVEWRPFSAGTALSLLEPSADSQGTASFFPRGMAVGMPIPIPTDSRKG